MLPAKNIYIDIKYVHGTCSARSLREGERIERFEHISCTLKQQRCVIKCDFIYWVPHISMDERTPAILCQTSNKNVHVQTRPFPLGVLSNNRLLFSMKIM